MFLTLFTSWIFEVPESADIDEPLNADVGDKICDYCADYNKRIYQLPVFFVIYQKKIVRNLRPLSTKLLSFNLVSILGIPGDCQSPASPQCLGGGQRESVIVFIFISLKKKFLIEETWRSRITWSYHTEKTTDFHQETTRNWKDVFKTSFEPFEHVQDDLKT
jgi:hypothetical protein